MGRGWKSTAAYVALLAASFVAAVAGSWFVGGQLDNYAYDFMFQLYQPKPWHTQSVILAIDERTLDAYGGLQGIRKPLAQALPLVAAAHPKAVAVDVILSNRGANPRTDAELADAFCATPNLALSSELLSDGFENPLPEFMRCHPALGHVYAQSDRHDAVTRAIALEDHFGHASRWALALQAFRLSRGAQIVGSPTGLQVGDTLIPVPYAIPHSADHWLMRVRFLPPNMPPIPRISLQGLLEHPALAEAFTGKVVFVGLTAVSEVHDRLFTPVSTDRQTTGIEIHADAFETLANGLFLTDVGPFWVLLFSLGLAVAAGLSFRYLPGWLAYAGGVLVLATAVLTPYAFFIHRLVFPLATPVSVAWFDTLMAAAYYHLVVRRNWRIEQAARTRYQQAMQFVTHEMRTPLSAIQGSSELISRYALTEEKRKQIAVLINSESKRLARMVEVFLSVERLSAGQMELKRETISVKEILEVCVIRAQPLADRKHIAVKLEPVAEELQLTGDRELMEYACYNLLTNAVKYSPRETRVTISAAKDASHIRIDVRDQGIGMDQKEVKQIFQKFYRTRRAEESGEAGTGIGLSIVQQIVEQHGGHIDVASQPGVGSCFTLLLPAAARVAAPTAAERN